MKHILGVLAIGMLAFASCKKEKVEEVFGVCGTDPNAMPTDTTQFPPRNPDSTARVATVTEADNNGNNFTRQLFYNAAGLVDSVVCTGSKSYAQRFTHTADYTISHVYDAAGTITDNIDSIRLNAAGYPTVMYKSTGNKVELISTFTYDTEGFLISRRYNYEPNRYSKTVYYTWEAGNLVSYNINSGNATGIFLYTYFLLNPAMPGEPQQLSALFETGRPMKQSANLRISQRNATEKNPTMIVYRWEKGRIAAWLSEMSTKVTAELTYYN